MKRLLLFCFLFISYVFQIQAYDVIDRYKLLEDKFKTDEMLRPLGHDFLIDATVVLNKNLFELIDDIDKISKESSGKSDAEKLLDARTLLDKYDSTEQTARVKLNLGIPIFSFTAWGVKIVPDFRIGVGWGANIGIRSEILDANALFTLVNPDIPDEFKAILEDGFPPAGTDIYQYAYEQLEAELAPLPVPDKIKEDYEKNKGKYIMPDTSLPVPNLYAYTKLDVTSGFLINYKKNDFFGYLNLYGLHRTDFRVRLTAEAIANKVDFMDGAENLNSQAFAVLDYKLGYKAGRYSMFALVEEVELSRISDNLEEGGDLIYKIDPLIRLHADARFEFLIFSITPFVGLHKRKGYDFADGIYAGADWGGYVWGDRLGLQLRTMADTEHVTISPRMKLWLMQLEYILKAPITSKKDDVKVAMIHSVNLRFFF